MQKAKQWSRQRVTGRNLARLLSLLAANTLVMTARTAIAQTTNDEVDSTAQINSYSLLNPNALDSSDSNSAPPQISTEEFMQRAPAVTSVYPLAWEAKIPASFQWSDFTLKTISAYGTSLESAHDVQSFCPTYSHLNADQKVNFWGQLISVMTQYESEFKPTSHYRESSMGTDRITGRHVYSDGLLQLSYQDVEQYHFCSEFDWNHDKSLPDQDPRKTIFDPYINLRCGIRILNAQIARTGYISYSRGQYWSVLKPQRIARIKAFTRKIPYCASK